MNYEVINITVLNRPKEKYAETVQIYFTFKRGSTHEIILEKYLYKIKLETNPWLLMEVNVARLSILNISFLKYRIC
jgi:hypothetical protein